MIGVFDSGVGGLTVVRAIKEKCPNEKVIYVGDTARVPWGTKSKRAVRKFSQEITNFLVSKGVGKIVIACNTASAVAADQLKKDNPQVKFFDVITPCISKIIGNDSTKENRVLVIGTQATIRSGVYKKRLQRSDLKIKYFSKACPLFVPLVEEGWINEKITDLVVEKYLGKYRQKKIGMIILGCTHYPLLKSRIVRLFGKSVEVISSADAVAEQIGEEIKSQMKKQAIDDEFFFSDWSRHNEKFIKLILGIKPNIKINGFDVNEK